MSGIYAVLCMYLLCVAVIDRVLHVSFALWPGQETCTHFLAYLLHSYISRTGCSGS